MALSDCLTLSVGHEVRTQPTALEPTGLGWAESGAGFRPRPISHHASPWI